jgi:hypothetical protein
MTHDARTLLLPKIRSVLAFTCESRILLSSFSLERQQFCKAPLDNHPDAQYLDRMLLAIRVQQMLFCPRTVTTANPRAYSCQPVKTKLTDSRNQEHGISRFPPVNSLLFQVNYFNNHTSHWFAIRSMMTLFPRNNI